MNKSIIISLIIFLLLSFGFLAYTETKQQSPENQNWWVVYFANPKNESLDFVIENNSSQNQFHYEISDGKNKITEADVSINKGTKKEIPVNIENFKNEKITVKVNSENDKKEIYKNL